MYLAYGNHASGNNKYLTVGKNSSENDKLNNGLRIDNSYWINKYFWLRAPYKGYDFTAQGVHKKKYVFSYNVGTQFALVPAFELIL